MPRASDRATEQKQPYTLLIIDDDPLVNSSLQSVLQESFENVVAYTDAAEALEKIDTLRPDLILLDIFLGNINGLDILARLREREITIPVIMITAFSDIKLAVRAIKLGAEDFIVKPLDLEQLEVTIRKVLENYELRRKVELLQAFKRFFAQIFIHRALHNAEEGIGVVQALEFGFGALGPAQAHLQRFARLLVCRFAGRAFIQLHGDIGIEHGLNLHGNFGR